MNHKIRIINREFQGVQMLHGSFRVLGNPFRFCQYYIDGLLVDTGPLYARPMIVQFTDKLKPEQITLTHFHEDHSGNAAWLANRYQIPVKMHEQTAQIMSKPPQIPFYRRKVWGQMEPVSIEKTEQLTDELRTPRHQFRVLHTPGHAEDHIVLVEENQGWVFAGDLYLGKHLNYALRGESVPQLIQSVKKVLQYRFDTIFCGHAGIVENGKAMLTHKLDFLLWLENETSQLSEKGYGWQQITRTLLKRNRWMEWVSNGEISAAHLIRSIMNDSAHSPKKW